MDANGTARRLWWLLTSADDDVADAAMELLGRVVSQATEEKVAALGDNPPLFAPATEKRRQRTILLVLSAIVAADFKPGARPNLSLLGKAVQP